MAFQSFLTAGLATIRALARGPVTYQRGAASVAIDAAEGKSQITLPASDNTLTVIESQDFLITAADLVLDGILVLPQRNDKILKTINGQVQTYQVLDLKGAPSYYFSDANNTALRIHTKLIKTEDA